MTTRPLIQPATITRLTALDERAMPEVVTLLDVTEVSDNAGGTTRETTERTTTGRLTVVSGQEAAADIVREKGRYRLAIPKDTAVTSTTGVRVNGRAYRITFLEPLTSYSTSRKIGLDDATA